MRLYAVQHSFPLPSPDITHAIIFQTALEFMRLLIHIYALIKHFQKLLELAAHGVHFQLRSAQLKHHLS